MTPLLDGISYIEKTPLLIFVKNELTTKNYCFENLNLKIQAVEPKMTKGEIFINTLLAKGFLKLAMKIGNWPIIN